MFGNLVTCIPDSTAVLNKSLIVFKQDGHKEVNENCPDKPMATYNYVESWPTWIFFDFKEKSFFYVTNFRPHKSGDGTYSADDAGGSFKYYRKEKTLVLVIPEYNWQKTFLVQYDRVTKMVELVEAANKEELKVRSKRRDDKEVKILNNKEQK